MKKTIKYSIISLATLTCIGIGTLSAATYSKTISTNVSYGSQCTGKISDKASVNSSSLDWSFTLNGSTVSTKNGYSFAKPYTSSVTYSSGRTVATQKVGYSFYNSLGNSTGGGIKTAKFTYSNNSVSGSFN